jgi:hypothetical protein
VYRGALVGRSGGPAGRRRRGWVGLCWAYRGARISVPGVSRWALRSPVEWLGGLRRALREVGSGRFLGPDLCVLRPLPSQTPFPLVVKSVLSVFLHFPLGFERFLHFSTLSPHWGERSGGVGRCTEVRLWGVLGAPPVAGVGAGWGYAGRTEAPGFRSRGCPGGPSGRRWSGWVGSEERSAR